MKNSLSLASLVLALGYPCVVAAEVIGTVPAAVPNGEVFIGVITATGLLAIFFRDYSRKSNHRPHPTRESARPTEIAVRPGHTPPPAAWVHQTVSL